MLLLQLFTAPVTKSNLQKLEFCVLNFFVTSEKFQLRMSNCEVLT
jgi:hypothetical protein